MNTSSTSSRFLFAAVYAAAALILLDQLAEAGASLFPFQFSDINWRFGAFGFLVGRTTTAVLIDVLLFLAAIGLGQRQFLRVLGVLHFVIAGVVIAAIAIFVLDFLELRNRVTPDASGTMLLASGRAIVVVSFAVLYCIWAGIQALRSTPRQVAGRRPDSPLLTQRQGS